MSCSHTRKPRVLANGILNNVLLSYTMLHVLEAWHALPCTLFKRTERKIEIVNILLFTKYYLRLLCPQIVQQMFILPVILPNFDTNGTP